MCCYQNNRALSGLVLIYCGVFLSLQWGGCSQPPFITTGFWGEKVLGFRENYLWGTELFRILHSQIYLNVTIFVSILCSCKIFIQCVMFDSQGLEYCEERYSQDLNGTAFPLRAQAINTRLISCQTIEKFRHHPDRDDSMSEGFFIFIHIMLCRVIDWHCVFSITYFFLFFSDVSWYKCVSFQLAS